jgi:hypothetical protein
MLVIRSTMTRKLMTAAIVLMIAGLAPVAAIIGFCTRMPCCNHASSALTTDLGGCCTTITCYDAPSARLANADDAATSPAKPVAVLIAATPPAVPIVVGVFIDASPPRTTGGRLAALSILLI